MKTWLAVILVVALAVIVVPTLAAEKGNPQTAVPKYDPAT